MKRRRILLILLGSVAAITLALFIWPREREPEYNGVPLSTWLERYNDNNPQAAEAIRHIGTNALPFLLRWIQYEPPCWRKSLNNLQAKLPKSVQTIHIVRVLFEDKYEKRAIRAVKAFWPLGSKGRPALYELAHLVRTTNSRQLKTRSRAVTCLMNMNHFGEVISRELNEGQFR